ncbi:hypothetical protein TNCV_4199631 [Trichonephila clavipes]|uniref:Uncharacterized protein n=1 Tax=Trichonephila clavipes TaxID=2585209 RepID=A0A8X7BII3_TRICX|nr:hypothetical protein TNCV_4199631 [Trichonephila clavipes]
MDRLVWHATATRLPTPALDILIPDIEILLRRNAERILFVLAGNLAPHSQPADRLQPCVTTTAGEANADGSFCFAV